LILSIARNAFSKSWPLAFSKSAIAKKNLVTGRPDTLQIEMAFGEDTRLLNALELMAAFRQDCRQPVDTAFCLGIVFNSCSEAMPQRVVPRT
jgi:hypothetical protein